jgi:hypothetical protein
MTLVWYAAYGSNLSRGRFDVYLTGGEPEGATHECPGCRDATPPAEVRVWESESALRFGGVSKTWDGGVALLDPAAGSVRAKLRLYLVTHEQFEDVVAQENWLAPGSVVLPVVESRFSIGDAHMYGVVLRLGDVDGRPVLTVTQDQSASTNAPSARYLRHIARGLSESHELSGAQIATYLAAAPGVAGAFGSQELLGLLA